jgi:hypothetical protein
LVPNRHTIESESNLNRIESDRIAPLLSSGRLSIFIHIHHIIRVGYNNNTNNVTGGAQSNQIELKYNGIEAYSNLCRNGIKSASYRNRNRIESKSNRIESIIISIITTTTTTPTIPVCIYNNSKNNNTYRYVIIPCTVILEEYNNKFII